jgi:tRNA dimethylallyltransferase
MPPNLENHIIIIAGPTAVGKTAVAVSFAKRLNTVIISADSRQCYAELNIGVARPSPEELAAVKHYFIASHSIKEEVNAGLFEQYALQAAAEIFNQCKQAVMVGGTGLYIKTFCEGIDDMPVIDPLVRARVTEAYRQNGLAWLQKELAAKDPAFWKVGEQQNPQRLMRALEIFYATGMSITAFRNGYKAARPFRVTKIGMELPRELLYQRINTRVEQMMEAGLLNEAKAMYDYKTLNGLQTVGYKELFDYLDGLYSLDEAVDQIKQNTRHYAKRQMTWFKKDVSIKWIDARDADQVLLEFDPEC